MRVPERDPREGLGLAAAMFFALACAAVVGGVLVREVLDRRDRGAGTPPPASPPEVRLLPLRSAGEAPSPVVVPEPPGLARAETSPHLERLDETGLGGGSEAPARARAVAREPRPALRHVSSPYGADAISGRETAPDRLARGGTRVRGLLRRSPDGPDEQAGPFIGRILLEASNGSPPRSLGTLAALLQASARGDRSKARSLAESMCAAGYSCVREGAVLVLSAPGGPNVRYDSDPEDGGKDHFVISLPTGRSYEFWTRP